MNIAIALNKKVIVQAYVLLASIAVNVKEKVTLYYCTVISKKKI